jgi:uncharacterized membrane protein
MLALVLSHTVAGAFAILAGVGALVFRKGSPRHRLVGRLFAASLVGSALAGSAIALLVDNQFIAFIAGLLTVYLVVSGVLAVSRRNMRGTAAALLVVSAGLALWFYGLSWTASQSTDGKLLGYDAGPYIFLGSVALLALLGDAYALLNMPLSRASALSRHLWRMCFAFFIAAGSLFTGPGASAFPEAVRASGLLSVPEPLILLVMLAWLIRVRVRRGRPVAVS